MRILEAIQGSQGSSEPVGIIGGDLFETSEDCCTELQ